MKARLAARARVDLADVRIFTIETWSYQQWLRYYATIKSTMQRIGQNPHAGQLPDDLLPGLRARPCRSHMMFWVIEADRPVILRILHQSRNLSADQFIVPLA